jgi:hypothetical protein
MRFTIRDVLWLTVVVALAVGWFLERGQSSSAEAENRYLLEAIDRAGYVPSGDFIGPNLHRK